MGFPAVRLTVHALDVVLSVQRRYHFISYELCFATAGSQTIKHTVKYTKIHLCLTLVAYNGRGNTSTLRRLPRHSHQLPGTSIARGKRVPSSVRNIV